ncbi:hypothetical protein LTR08_002204 [Meristemomyces frigidus]|nr:hypothetical protein LTR08_002204 [Meristemomyces frigidus]
MLVSLTVGKVDAGVAVLLTEDKRLIEFPSILLPPDIHSGSIVDINVARNHALETTTESKFAHLQSEIHTLFGTTSPQPPQLRCRNATQTSVVLEWDPLSLATAELRTLSLYRNGSKAGNIPPGKLSTKISGLALDTEYTFHLVLRTSAGQYGSERVVCRTHKMTDLHGITITPGVMPAQLKESLAETVNRIGAKLIEGVRIDTTHFVCTEPRGVAWEKAVELNVPVVVPDWVLGCEREGRIVGVRGYYLDADPSKRTIGPPAQPQQPQQQQQQQRLSVSATQGRESAAQGPRIEHTPPTPERGNGERAMQAQRWENPRSVAAVEEPPTPPPKPTSFERAEGESESEAGELDGRSLAGTTLAERPRSAGHAAEGDEDEDDEEEEEEEVETEKKGSMQLDGSSGDGGERKSHDEDAGKETSDEEEAEPVADEDGKFDEVTL